MSHASVVILAGGRGSRLGEHTDLIPKPMVKVQGIPIIERIVRHFQNCGFNDFIISAGYKCKVLFDHFHNFDNVNVFDTGEETQTAGRILGVKDYIKSDVFLACYGDGLTDYDPFGLLMHHYSHPARPICTMMAVHPLGRFGELQFNSRGMVTKFSEKPISDKWINGGYFCFSKEVFDYISSSSDILETDVFSRLLKNKALFCDSYEGFWRSLDTPKDLAELNEMELP